MSISVRIVTHCVVFYKNLKEKFSQQGGEKVSPAEKLTEGDERLIAREIVKLLRQKGVSYNQAVRILKEAKKTLRGIPLTGYQV